MKIPQILNRPSACAFKLGFAGVHLALGLLLLIMPGCAQSNMKLGRQSQVGSLRETVGQLETEKSKLERQVASLNNENQRLEDRLVQEQAHSDQLATRLEDTRRLTRGIDFDSLDERTASVNRRGGSADGGSGSDRRTTPANQKSRKTPFAQIPGEIQPANDDDGGSRSSGRSRSSSFEDEPSGPSRSTSNDLFSHQDSAASDASIRAARQRWLSIAQDLDQDSRYE